MKFLQGRKLEAFAVVMFAVLLMAGIHFTQGTTTVNKPEQEMMAASVRAGITDQVSMEGSADLEEATVDIVAATMQETPGTDQPEELVKEDTQKQDEKAEEKPSEWADRLLVDVKSSLKVREKANAKSDVVGMMLRGNVATILSEKGDWVKIKSGDVKGYVKKEYCVMGEKAESFARELGCYQVTSKQNGLRVRKSPSTEGGIYTVLEKGQSLSLAKKDSEEEGWVKVLYKGQKAYVSEEFVKVSLKLEKAMTMKQYQKMLQEQAAAKAAASKGSSSSSASRTQESSVSASVDDVTLLAALIYCEAGNQSYEGKLAVGAVVCNRIRSSRFPNTLRGVIYQRGQFGPSGSAALARRLTRTIPSSCRRAAEEALSGVDNVGGRMFFLPVRSGRTGLVIGGHVFF